MHHTSHPETNLEAISGNRPSGTDSVKLSILIPTYNRAEMLRQCLQSTQSVTADCEIVVLDNGSPDHTPEVIASFMKNDPRIRSIRHERNMGPVYNFNRALQEARGSYICLMGDDDLFLSGNFEKKTAILDAHPKIDLVYSLWHRIDEQGRSQGVVLWPGLLTYPYIGGRNEFFDLLAASYIMLQAVVFRRSLWEQLGGFDENSDLSAGNDWDMLLRYCYGRETAFLNEPLVCVRVHSRSYTESVARTNAGFASGRLAIWKKWLVENDNPPVLDESLWQRMRQAFLPDLQWELGSDRQKIESYLNALQEIKRLHAQKAAYRFERLAGPLQAGSSQASGRPSPSEEASSRENAAMPTLPPPSKSVNPPSANVSGLPGILWNAPLFDPSGYADEARHFLLALDEAGHRISAQALRWSDRVAVLPTQTRNRLLAMTARKPKPGSIHVSHIFPPHFNRRPDALLNVGRTMFETDRLPQGWAEACNRMDRVWVPSEFNRETFARAGVQASKIAVVPGTMDMTPYDPSIPPLEIENARGYNFLSVFDWTLRKGWDLLVRAFVEEFDPDEDVALIIKTHSSLGYTIQQLVEMTSSHIENSLSRDPDRIPDIIFEDANLPSDRIPNLYRAADCFVLPTRGEGWGRPYMEAMAMGLPTIGTRWSGNTAFMTGENSFLIDCQVVPVPEAAWQETPTYRGHRWAEPEVGHLRSWMRFVFAEREKAKAVGERARADIMARFSYQRVAEIIGEEIARAAIPAVA